MATTAKTGVEQLLVAARRGDKAALGDLLEGHSPYLTLLAKIQLGRRLQGKVDPSDVVQEAFLDAHRQFPIFRGESEREFVVWLRQILLGRVLNVVRRYVGAKGRDVRLERNLADEMEHSSRMLECGLAAPNSTPSQAAARSEQAVRVAEAIASLPEHYRDVIVLRHIEERPFAEVAERMSRSIDSVEKLWVRALAKLRQTLGDEA
ncbi:MAG TPA: sigma-70 family RNA polymerase sigma factor [Planctomycetia bacterium]|nr:sigma-70 family RNA polymerase sigma factor [Planctomycetia bacterium]